MFRVSTLMRAVAPLAAVLLANGVLFAQLGELQERNTWRSDPVRVSVPDDDEDEDDDTPPAELTVQVDCNAGDSIDAALQQPAGELTIEISGICDENVVIERENVTLTGADPTLDGIRGAGESPAVVRLRNVKGIALANLTISGGAFHGIIVGQSDGRTSLTNCRVVDNGLDGLAAYGALNVVLENTEIVGNSRIGLSAFSAALIVCYGCTVADNGGGGVLGQGATVVLFESTVSGPGWTLGTAVHGSIGFYGGSLGGWISGEEKGLLIIDGADQTSNSDKNRLNNGSTATVSNSHLAGDFEVSRFSNLVLEAGTSVDGALLCNSGGDAFCDDPSSISGGVSGCSSCPP